VNQLLRFHLSGVVCALCERVVCRNRVVGHDTKRRDRRVVAQVQRSPHNAAG
jgi:hypothetical protein